MNVVIVMLGIIAVLFATVYFSKRRFGVLGLALAAGVVLSNVWAASLTPFVQQAGLEIVAPPLQSLVAAVLILLPSIILLFSGPSYDKKMQRIVGAGTYALLAAVFLLEPLGSALVLRGEGKVIYDFLLQNRNWIITAGLVFALFDVLMVKTHKASKEK